MIRTVVALLSLVAAASAATTPGKLAVWSARNNNRRRTTSGPAVRDSTSYNTRSFDVEQIRERIGDLTKHAEVVVFIQHEQDQFPASVMDSISTSNALDVFPHVYHSSSPDGVKSLGSALLESPTFKVAKADLTDLNDETIFTDSKVDAFVVTLKGHEADNKVMKRLAEIGKKKNVVFVSVVEPSGTAPAAKAEYSRLLAGTGQEDYNDGVITQDQLYLPEGTEFTIFYAGEYLYLTPDIFTGIMTMLFMFFVGLIGFTCLGDIQGPACFPTKLPPLGREG